jgi:Arc/MetJ-type ribon-helix-helix transcriptional regulator
MKRPKKKGDNKVEYGTISLPIPLINKIKERIKDTGFNSVSSYVSFVLREILSSTDKGSKGIMNKKKREEIIKRLKKLGYLN